MAFAALLGLTAAVRLVGIDREPFWLDEVYSHDIGDGSMADTLRAVARFDDQKPSYHILLKGWRGALGSSVVALRGFSTLWSAIGIGLLVLLARDIGRSWTAGLIGALLAAVNPLDVYFAQEARMYAQAAALAALSTWLLLRWMRTVEVPFGRRGWPWAVGYGATAALLISTHYIAVTVLVAQGLFALVAFTRARAWRSVVVYLVCAVACALALLPWLLFVRQVRAALYSAEAMAWIPSPAPTDPLVLITRDLLWGHAHLSPQGWWLATALSALVLALIVVTSLRAIRTRRGLGPRSEELLYAAWLVVGPLLLALVTSWAFRPVFYRPRFCLLVLPPFLALVAVAVDRLSRLWAKVACTAALVALMASATISQQRGIEKTGLAAFAALWRDQGPPDDVLFYPRWNRRVAGYYLGRPVLNVPTREQLDKALRRGKPRRVWVCRVPTHDMAAEPQAERGLLDWVLSLGPQRRLPPVDNVEVVEVTAQPLPPLYPALRPGTHLAFDDRAAEPYLGEGWYRAEPGFRWSRGTRAELLFALDPPAASELRLEMFCFRRQRVTVTLNTRELTAFDCAEWAPHLRRIPIPPGVVQHDNTLLFDLPDATSPAAVGESADTRKLALGVSWLEVR